MKILIDDVGIYITKRSGKWPNSLVITRPSEEGRYINVPMENVPFLIEALKKIAEPSKKHFLIIKTKDKNDITIDSENIDGMIYKVSEKPEIAKSQLNMWEIIGKKEKK